MDPVIFECVKSQNVLQPLILLLIVVDFCNCWHATDPASIVVAEHGVHCVEG